MKTIEIELEDELVTVLRQANPSLPVAARELMVLELYRRAAISGGKAAELLGMARLEFIRHASRRGLDYIAMTPDEWADERDRSRS